MKIFTEVTEDIRQHLAKVAVTPMPTQISVLVNFQESYITPLNVPFSEELNLENINYLMDTFQVKDDDAKILVKQTDELLRLKGYKAKRILIHTFHSDIYGNRYVESDQYAVELIK